MKKKTSFLTISSHLKKPFFISTSIFILFLITFTFFWFSDAWEHYVWFIPLVWFAWIFVPILFALVILWKIPYQRKNIFVYFLVGCSTSLYLLITGGVMTLVRGWDEDALGFITGVIFLVFQLLFLVFNYFYFSHKNKK